MESEIFIKKPKVIVRLSGGLGNQLFQLAAAHFVSHIVDPSEISLDCRYLSNYTTSRSYELDFLVQGMPRVNTQVSFLSIVGCISKFRLAKVLNRHMGKYALLGSVHAIEEIEKKNSPNFLCYAMDDYFQNPKILRLDEIKSQFKKVSTEFLILFKNKIPELDWKKTVGIHLRRGDYASVPAAQKKYLTIDLSFYLKAVEHYPPDSQFVIFGDTPDLSDTLASKIGGISIHRFGLSVAEEFILLSQMQNIVIANSTFSWWAAVLGLRPDKTIIAPKDWFKEHSENIKNPLLIPEFLLL